MQNSQLNQVLVVDSMMIEKIHRDSICILPKLKDALRDTAKEEKVESGKKQGRLNKTVKKKKGARSLCS